VDKFSKVVVEDLRMHR